MNGLRALLAALLTVVATWACAAETVTQPFVGVTLIARAETQPRPLRMHIVRVDPAARGIRFRLAPRSGPLHTTKQTTPQFLAEQHAQLAVNAHFFEPWPPPR